MENHKHDNIYFQGCCGHDAASNILENCCHHPSLAHVEEFASSGRKRVNDDMPPLIEPKFFGHPDFYRLVEEEKVLHSNKNRDYTLGKDPLHNLRQSEKFGVPAHIGVLIRLTDKYSREETLALNPPAVVEESFLDVQRDKSVYSKIEHILYKEFEECPFKDRIIANLKENAGLLGEWRGQKLVERVIADTANEIR